MRSRVHTVKRFSVANDYRVPWGQFRKTVIDRMKPGEHVCMVGPTGAGKSTLGYHLIKNRPYVVVLDAKGGDSTLDAMGMEVVHEWPLRNEQARINRGHPIRMILRPVSFGRERFTEAHDLFTECITRSLQSRKWTLYVDELRLTSDGRTIDLGPEIEVAYMTGRGREVSFISATQAPVFVPGASRDQSMHQFHWPLTDRMRRKRQAEIVGMDYNVFDELTRGMREREVLYFHPPRTLAIVHPPKVRAPRVVESLPEETGDAPANPRVGKLRAKLW